MKTLWKKKILVTRIFSFYFNVFYPVEEKAGLFDTTTQSRLLTTIEKKAFENIVGKGENADNQYFVLFSHCFLLIPQQTSILSHIYFVVCKSFQFGAFLNFAAW